MKVTFKQLAFFILILCLPFGFGAAALAQAPDSVPAASSAIKPRAFSQAKLKQLRESSDFEYFEEVRPDESFLEKLWRRIKKWLSGMVRTGQSTGLWEVLIYVAIAGAIVLFILKIQGIGFGSLFGKKSLAVDVPYEVYEENIHEMDLKNMIAQAVEQRDFRKAIRLHYLQSLKNLANLEFIRWKPGKTNRSYIAEIKDPTLRHEFEQLTSMFEYVWYGGAALGDELFASAKAEFAHFDNKLSQFA